MSAKKPHTGRHDHQEVEWQFDALDLRPVARRLEVCDFENGFQVRASGEKAISDAYLDTADWRIYRAGYALRLRRAGKSGREATLKRLVLPPDSGPTTRREMTEVLDAENTAPSDLPNSGGPVGERVKALTGRAGLRTLFEVETARKTFRVSADEGKDGIEEPVAEVALDETEIPVEGETPVALSRVEVEVERGTQEDFALFVEEFERGLGLTPALASKFEAGLLALGLSPPEAPDFGPKDPSPSMSAGEFAFAILRARFEVFLKHEPGTRLGEDPEELHDMRVASRRLRAAMKVFEEFLPVRSKRFRKDLKWLAGVLGEVRDLDVQLEDLEERTSEASPEDREPLGELEGALTARREKKRKAMLRALDSRRYAGFVESYSAFLRWGPSRRSAEARRPVSEAGPGIVRRYYKKFKKAGDALSTSSSGEEYHELRKRGKRLRYALEFFSGVYGEPAREMVAALKRLQDVLGEHQDSVVASARLREIATPAKGAGGRLSPQTAFVLGKVAARYEARATGVKEEFPAAYAKVRGKRRKRLLKAIARMESAGEAEEDNL